MIKLSYIKSDNRQYNVERCLSLIKTEITKGLKNAKRVIIVPDCIVTDNQLAATHVDTLEALLAFIEPYVKGQITLAGSSSIGNTIDAFNNYGYYKLQDSYDLAIIDLNLEDFTTSTLINSSGEKWSARISKPLLESDYIISVCPPKTHKEIFYTGALNNVVSSSIYRPLKKRKNFFGFGGEQNDREIVYSANKIANENIHILANKLKIELSIVDGFEIMQGDGPINGQLVPGHFCVAGTEPNNVDILTCKCLGLDSNNAKYLENPASWSDYFVIGDDWQKNIIEVQPPVAFHST